MYLLCHFPYYGIQVFFKIWCPVQSMQWRQCCVFFRSAQIFLSQLLLRFSQLSVGCKHRVFIESTVFWDVIPCMQDWCLAAVLVKSQVCWEVMPCWLGSSYQPFWRSVLPPFFGSSTPKNVFVDCWISEWRPYIHPKCWYIFIKFYSFTFQTIFIIIVLL